MPVLAGISPGALKAVFEGAGYRCIDEDQYNWLMALDDGEPFVIPKVGRVVGVDVMSKAAQAARAGRFSNDLIGAVTAETHKPDPEDD